MINLSNNISRNLEIVKANNEKIDEFGIGAFSKISTIKTDFYPMSYDRIQALFHLFKKLCVNNNCDGLVISPIDISNTLNASPSLYSKLYFEQTCTIDEVINLINRRERKAIVLILDFSLYYCNNGELVGDSKKNTNYYYDLLASAVNKSGVSAILESDDIDIESYTSMMFTNINDTEHILFDNGYLIKTIELL